MQQHDETVRRDIRELRLLRTVAEAARAMLRAAAGAPHHCARCGPRADLLHEPQCVAQHALEALDRLAVARARGARR